MKHKCKKCLVLKYRILKMVTKGNKLIEVDERGFKWIGKICGPCSKPPPKPKKIKEIEQLNISRVASCKHCGLHKTKTLIKIYEGPAQKTKKYADETGSWWNGSRCPDCEKQRQKDEHEPIVLACKICSNTFIKRNAQKYCSRQCRYKDTYTPSGKGRGRPRKYPVKPKKEKKALDLNKPRVHCKLFIKSCVTCSAVFTTSQGKAVSCKKNHNPSVKRAKKQRKWITDRCGHPISKFYKEEIINIYLNRPEGMHVDHIIPINGKNVSGLHVPWNMQYLTPEANLKKSNSVT